MGEPLVLGVLGKALPDCHKRRPVKFGPIKSPVEMFPDSNKDLSTDQRYLYDGTFKIVSSGGCPSGFGERILGTLNHARWLTTANRILRLYIN